MHTSKCGKTTFVHNGDYSGDVIIVLDESKERRMRIPFKDLKEFVAGYVRDKKIGFLEQCSADYVLCGLHATKKIKE